MRTIWLRRQYYKLKYFFELQKRTILITFNVVVIIFFAYTIFTTVEAFGRRDVYNLSRAEFVYDFDYMMRVLVQNYPYFDVIYRRTGVYLPERSREIRRRLVRWHEPISFEIFWNTLRDDFFAYAWPVGHLRMVTELERRTIHELDRVHSRLQRVTRRPIKYRNYMNLIPDERHLALPSTFYTSGIPIKSIIEENRIAYLGVRAFTMVNIFCQRNINSFYESIADFEHLIIDMRGNPGGDMRYFTNLIAAPLIRGSLHLGYRLLYMGGRYNNELIFEAQQQGALFGGGIPFTDNISRPFFSDDIPACVMYDLSYMDYFMIRSLTVSQTPLRSRFEGTIWMLVDEYVYGQAQMAAWFSKETGFATLVGETTGGMASTTGLSNFFALPNTGIIVRYDPFFVTDENGRLLENGTDPHFFNLPGMDALETVLHLINQ